MKQYTDPDFDKIIIDLTDVINEGGDNDNDHPISDFSVPTGGNNSTTIGLDW